MKIIDETGAVVENPDLTLGYLTASTEEITHPAVEGVEEQWHWETVTEYPNGGKDVQKVIDVPGVPEVCLQGYGKFSFLKQTRRSLLFRLQRQHRVKMCDRNRRQQ